MSDMPDEIWAIPINGVSGSWLPEPKIGTMAVTNVTRYIRPDDPKHTEARQDLAAISAVYPHLDLSRIWAALGVS